MEVILLKDVKKLGKQGDLVKVSDGYARNYILPQKLGVEANAKNRNEWNMQKEKENRKKQEILEEARRFAEEIGQKTVVLQIRTGEKGRSFGSISTKEITHALKEQFALEVDKKKLQLEETINHPGYFEIPVRLHAQVTAKLKVKVEEA